MMQQQRPPSPAPSQERHRKRAATELLKTLQNGNDPKKEETELPSPGDATIKPEASPMKIVDLNHLSIGDEVRLGGIVEIISGEHIEIEAPDFQSAGLHSTFDIRSHKQVLDSVRASNDRHPIWSLGFDTQVFSSTFRVLGPVAAIQSPLVPLKAGCDAKVYESFLQKDVRLLKDSVWYTLCSELDPARIPILKRRPQVEASSDFYQLAEAFFGGRAIDEMCGVVDTSPINLNLDDADRKSSDNPRPYTVTYGTTDNAKTWAQEPLKDLCLSVFLIDLILSKDIEKTISKPEGWRLMIVGYAPEHKTELERLSRLEKT